MTGRLPAGGPPTAAAGPRTAAADRAPARSHLLVTGGAGFIGSAFVRGILARHDGTRITVLDKLTYAGSERNLDPTTADPEQAERLAFVHGDIADPEVVRPLVAAADAVVNFAAESHVDRSILDPEAFLVTGVIGVHVLLEACRRERDRAAIGERAAAPRFLQVSTDEVYGSVATGRSGEGDPLGPRSPYSAAKAAGELLVQSYVVTHGLDAVVTRGSNTYGPYQHPEKLIPLFITNAMDDEPLPLYGDGLQRRDWLFVSDHAGAVEHVLRHGTSGETYNIPGSVELANRDVVAALLDRLGKPWSLVRTVEDRPGHDRRYAMDGSRLEALGWRNRVSFEDGIATTVDWYRANEPWWRAARSGGWDAYYDRQYGMRLAHGQATNEHVATTERVAPPATD
ncbi:MAG: dTDP-glucose 4,6-dehydratase [Chloroflexi bacterium]|nr:dTDP-glucose 4,6-dehydratase [Chloroflexota bacterium]